MPPEKKRDEHDKEVPCGPVDGQNPFCTKQNHTFIRIDIQVTPPPYFWWLINHSWNFLHLWCQSAEKHTKKTRLAQKKGQPLGPPGAASRCPPGAASPARSAHASETALWSRETPRSSRELRISWHPIFVR